jgi:hypothetical protein
LTASPDEHKQKKTEYHRMKMREIYNRRKQQPAAAQNPINQTQFISIKLFKNYTLTIDKKWINL